MPLPTIPSANVKADIISSPAYSIAAKVAGAVLAKTTAENADIVAKAIPLDNADINALSGPALTNFNTEIAAYAVEVYTAYGMRFVPKVAAELTATKIKALFA